MIEDALNKGSSNGDEDHQAATEGGVDYIKDSDGVWRFADSGIEVPGAEDLTLTARFQPKTVVTADGESIERVIVSGGDVLGNPKLLGWCLNNGARITDSYGKLVEVLVPYELWCERDRVPGAIQAPEHSPKKPERDLAKAERKYREAERELEDAAQGRAELLSRYADDITRQRAHEITGLSVGRIQQLSRPQVPQLSERLLLELLDTTEHMTPAQIATAAAEIKGLSTNKKTVRGHLSRLEQRGLVQRGKGGITRLTTEGRVAVRAAHADKEEQPLDPGTAERVSSDSSMPDVNSDPETAS